MSSKNYNITEEGTNLNEAQNYEDKGNQFLEESKDIELPLLKGVISLFNNKEALYALKDYGNQLDEDKQKESIIMKRLDKIILSSKKNKRKWKYSI